MKILSVIGSWVVFFTCFCFTAKAQLMYGMTSSGGNYNGGTILSIDTSGNFNIEYSFQHPGGHYPMSELMMASDGKFYGVTLLGGIYDSCTIFCWDTVNKLYTDVYDFDITSGDFPSNTPVEIDGVLYGTTFAGGAHDAGVIYTYDIFTHVYSNIYDFPLSDLGHEKNPFGGLMLHTNGKLYGMNAFGAYGGVGTIYSFDPITHLYTEEYQFNSSSRSNPFGKLVEVDGLLYGIASALGPSPPVGGVIFSYDPVTGNFSDLFKFEGAYAGVVPTGTLLPSSNGLLYGLTKVGGSKNVGTIFSFNPVNHNFSTLHEFDITHGSMVADDTFSLPGATYPTSGKLLEVNGILYGATLSGGANNEGVFFQFDPANLIYTVLVNLDTGQIGAAPSGGLILGVNTTPAFATINGNAFACINSIDSATLSVHISNGLGPFDYMWSTGATSPSIKVHPGAGINNYSVTVTDYGKSQLLTKSIDVKGITVPSPDVAPLVENATVILPYDTSGLENFTIDYGDGSAATTALNHIYVDNGTYSVSLLAENQCGSITIVKEVNINGLDVSTPQVNNFNCVIYPNPNNGLCTLSFSGMIECLTVLDLNDKIVYQQYSIESDKLGLDLSSLSKGLYALRLDNGQKSGFSKLVIY